MLALAGCFGRILPTAACGPAGAKKTEAAGDVEESAVALVNGAKQTLSAERNTADALRTECCHRLLPFNRTPAAVPGASGQGHFFVCEV